MSLLSARDGFGLTSEVPLLPPLVCSTPAGDIGGYLLRAALRQQRPLAIQAPLNVDTRFYEEPVTSALLFQAALALDRLIGYSC